MTPGEYVRACEAKAIIRDLIRCCTEDTIPAYYQGTVKRARRFLDATTPENQHDRG